MFNGMFVYLLSLLRQIWTNLSLDTCVYGTCLHRCGGTTEHRWRYYILQYTRLSDTSLKTDIQLLTKQLNNLNASKSMGPDKMSSALLRKIADSHYSEVSIMAVARSPVPDL